MTRDGSEMLVVVLAVFLAGIGASAEASVRLADGVESHSGIEGVYERMDEAYQNLDGRTAGELYTNDAIYLAPGQPVIEGRDAIREVFDQYFQWVEETESNISITFDILSRRLEGSTVIDVGVFTVERTTGEGTSSSRGKFVVVAVEGDDGLWRFSIDSYSALPDDSEQ